MTQQRLISRQYMLGTLDSGAQEPPSCDPSPDPNCLVGDLNPSFHRIDSCSPGCGDGEVLNPSACGSNGMVPANIWCAPAHLGPVQVTSYLTTRAWHTPSNKVAKFLNNKYYGWLGNAIWEFDAEFENELLSAGFPIGNPSGNPGGSGSWTVAVSPIPASETSESAIGLYPMVIDDVPFLVSAAQSAVGGANATWKSIKLNGLTGVWTSGDISIQNGRHTPGYVGGNIHSEVRYRNKIYWVTNGAEYFTVGFQYTGPGIFSYDPEQDSITRIPFGSRKIRFPADLCVFQDKLYMLAKEDHPTTGKADLTVWRIGSTLHKVLTLETGVTSDNLSNFNGRNALFVDNYYSSIPKLYAINYMESKTGGVNGHGLWQMEMANGQLVNNGRLPSNPSMPKGVDFQVGEEDDIWRIFTDSKRESGNGGLPVWEYRSSSNRGANYQAYLFNGSGNTQTFWANVDAHFIFSYAHSRGSDMGARVANFGEVNMDIVGYDRSKASQGLLGINFKLLPSTSNYPAGTPLAVRFLVDTQGHPHKEFATLTTPSSGTLSGSNKLLMGAISGVTHSVYWDFASDNFNGLQNVNLIGHASTTGVT